MSMTLTKAQIEHWRDTGYWPSPDFPEQVLKLCTEFEALKKDAEELQKTIDHLHKFINNIPAPGDDEWIENCLQESRTE